MTVMFLIEISRLYLGYAGNLQEKVCKKFLIQDLFSLLIVFIFRTVLMKKVIHSSSMQNFLTHSHSIHWLCKSMKYANYWNDLEANSIFCVMYYILKIILLSDHCFSECHTSKSPIWCHFLKNPLLYWKIENVIQFLHALIKISANLICLWIKMTLKMCQ